MSRYLDRTMIGRVQIGGFGGFLVEKALMIVAFAVIVPIFIAGIVVWKTTGGLSLDGWVKQLESNPLNMTEQIIIYTVTIIGVLVLTVVIVASIASHFQRKK